MSYASVVEKNHPVYLPTNCPHFNHVVTMSNFPSVTKPPKPVAISSLSSTENGKNLPQTISQICEVPTASQDSSGFKLVKEKKKPHKSSQTQSAKNNKVKHNIASKFWKTSPSKAMSNSRKVHHKDNTNNATSARITNTPSDSSQGYSSDTDSDMGVNSVLRSQNTRGTGQDRNLKSPRSLNILNVDFLRRISLPN
ncbi:hypothetical protein AVEN_137424-1 [Araneus ventricosus]|uniref:Uncharacterized protein n=1 Tax=Araneus ventricosus TaxID=182803 RepID=A0A4Y2U501_ARAVE|nr:hypothetical protein AVEN_137424-1 [Araneus ventricosus]